MLNSYALIIVGHGLNKSFLISVLLGSLSCYYHCQVEMVPFTVFLLCYNDWNIISGRSVCDLQLITAISDISIYIISHPVGQFFVLQ